MSSLSNQQGKAFEYAVVKCITEHLQTVTLTARALIEQNKDELKFKLLPKDLQTRFKDGATKIYEWLDVKFNLSQAQNLIIIDRFPDSAGRSGDVVDTEIEINNSLNNSKLIINLSIKHRHKATKHHRPSATAIQCGYSKNSQENIAFRKNYKKITGNFKKSINNIEKFNELDDNIKLNLLYEPICQLVTNFINNNCQKSNISDQLFKFLIGVKNYYKINYQSDRNQIIIEKFAGISPVTSVVATTFDKYVTLTFSNNWIIKMRLHNAATIIKENPDLKFDAQPTSIKVFEEF